MPKPVWTPADIYVPREDACASNTTTFAPMTDEKRAEILAVYASGLSIRDTADKVGFSLARVRRVIETGVSQRRTRHAIPSTTDESAHGEASSSSVDAAREAEEQRSRIIAAETVYLADLRRFHGSPDGCPSLAQVLEHPAERRQLHAHGPSDLTGLLCGDPPPGRSALDQRRVS